MVSLASETRKTGAHSRVFPGSLEGKWSLLRVEAHTHTLALLESGELFAWGWNDAGQLGLGDDTDRTTPEPVAALSGRRVAAIACGDEFSFAALSTGELFSWGFNFCGALGLGDYELRNEPVQNAALSGKFISFVSCGFGHAAALTSSGALFIWGSNEEGQLGFGNRPGKSSSKSTPELLLLGCSATQVVCGPFHTVSFPLEENGDVLVWGRFVQEGIFSSEEVTLGEPRQVHFFDHCPLRSIHCGCGNAAAVVLENGELFMWGHKGASFLTFIQRTSKLGPKSMFLVLPLAITNLLLLLEKEFVHQKMRSFCVCVCVFVQTAVACVFQPHFAGSRGSILCKMPERHFAHSPQLLADVCKARWRAHPALSFSDSTISAS